MRIAVIGAGGVGGPFGAALARGGNDVTFVARGAHLDAMRRLGLRIEGAFGSVHVSPTQATDDPAEIGPVDVVLFCVKLWDVESVAEKIRPLIGPDTAVIPIQNGIDSAARLAPILGEGHVMGGVALINAVIEAPGLIRQPGAMQRIIFGELDGRRSARAEAFLAACEKSGLDATLTDGIEVALWEKFIFLVATSSVTAIVRQRVGVCRSDPETHRLFLDVLEEVAAVARAKGIPVRDDIVADRMAFIDASTPQSMASMAVDLVRGNRLELPWLAGKAVTLGRELGVPTPTTRVIWAALKPYENGPPA